MGWRPAARGAAATIAAMALTLLLAACGGSDPSWHGVDVSASSPPLALTMTRASDGKSVSEADYRGKVVMLYFGYTFCPDVCPTTLSNIAAILSQLGPAAADVRVLFVTVDPDRDNRDVLARYVKNFAPQIEGLRPTADALATLARRYRIVYSVDPATKDHAYEVTHSSAVYVFDRTGAARLLIPSLASSAPDIAGAVADLKRLIGESPVPGIAPKDQPRA
jgi:protein SCO1/2